MRTLSKSGKKECQNQLLCCRTLLIIKNMLSNFYSLMLPIYLFKENYKYMYVLVPQKKKKFQANTIATFTVMALEESVGQLSECISELSNLYESSVVTGFTITDQGHHRIVELQELVCRVISL